MIQFRNFIVHRYESIENEILLDIVKNHLDDFARFVQEIETYEDEMALINSQRKRL